MALKKEKPQPVARRGASGTVFAGATDNPEDTPTLPERQAAYVERRFMLPAPGGAA